MRRLLSLAVLLLLTQVMYSQSKNLDISGIVADTLGIPLPLSTVLLLDPVDTTLISYTRTEEDGSFILKRQKRAPALLKISYVGFMPQIINVNPEPAGDVNIGEIRLEEIAKDLFEVVVKAAKAPMSIRGDTIEYDASKFKVAPGSSVEDLLRRLPGIEVGQDGSISAEGQSVTKVTVDGKRFFGNDPKTATKNLPAEGIKKVQVFDEESEEQKLTGASSTPPEKTMNLELKEEFKKGGFGKIIAGAGTEERAEMKGNYNKFNKKEQFSIIGIGNNTGRNGLSWDDYQDFRGSQSFNWDDGGDFGFGGGGGYIIRYGGDEDDDDIGDITNSFFGDQSSGFPRNIQGGLNYSYAEEKTDLNAVYFFDRAQLTADATRNQENFLPDATYSSEDVSSQDNTNMGHRVQFRLEQKIDSLNTLVFNANGVLNQRDNLNDGTYRYYRSDNSLSNYTQYDNRFKQDARYLTGSLIYRKKFKKKGRSLGWSGAYFVNDSDQNGTQSSTNEFYDNAGLLDSTSVIEQDIAAIGLRQQVKSSAMYVEPFGKRFYWQTFYNYNLRLESVDRDVADVIQDTPSPNDFLSRYYDNRIDLHRLGMSLRYSFKGINLSAGMARQEFQLEGDFRSGPSVMIDTIIRRTFPNWIPNVNMSFDLKRNRYLQGSYTVNAREPSMRNLQPIVDNSNPLFIREGNPNLIPQIDHNIRMMFRQFSPATFTNLFTTVNYRIIDNAFVQEQTVDSLLVTNSKTINYKGGQSASASVNYGFPIIKNQFTINLNYGYSWNKRFALVNTIENATLSNGHWGQLRLNITPSEKLTLYLTGRFNLTDTKYSINAEQNQTLFNQTYSVDLNTIVVWGVFANVHFDYDIYQNDRFGFNQDVPILSASLYKVLFPNKRGEIRLSGYDLLNRNLGVNQYASANMVRETRTSTLARYYMLSFTYNLQGIDTSLKKGRGWW
ncbi:MAG: TonB-dependent receptor family protein [Saprospiraceae bacterium]|nr:TonB-dependent receptor family protein [Saprospiraceae bacterium]